MSSRSMCLSPTLTQISIFSIGWSNCNRPRRSNHVLPQQLRPSKGSPSIHISDEVYPICSNRWVSSGSLRKTRQIEMFDPPNCYCLWLCCCLLLCINININIYIYVYINVVSSCIVIGVGLWRSLTKLNICVLTLAGQFQCLDVAFRPRNALLWFIRAKFLARKELETKALELKMELCHTARETWG